MWASGIVGLEGDGLTISGDGLVELALVLQGIAEIVVGFGVVGIEGDGLTVGGDGLVELALSFRALPRLLWASG